MKQFRADLHCHSTFSDGTATPEELIDLAAESGLSGLSITDHDTVDAYHTALPYAHKKNISLISGVEFSCIHREESVHILGYAFSLTNQDLLNFCKLHQTRREKRLTLILEKLKQHEMPVTLEPQSFGSIGRPHIALEMIKHGYVRSVEEAFKKYLGEGCACYVPGEAFTVEESIRIIHKAGGFAVIAHPHLIRNSKIVTDLLKMPFDGVEAYYARFAPHQEKAWVKIGQYRQWLVTGGSDFHGTVKPHIPLGCSWVGTETFQQLHQRFLQNEP
jgi:3',5'-nucleoside bisphosphate phosphatase